MVSIQADGFYHPASTDDVVALVRKARQEGAVLRVKGAGHSVPQAIYPDGFPYRDAEFYAPSQVSDTYWRNFQPVPVPPGQIPVLLDKMNQVTFEDQPGPDGTTLHLVHAQAGVHLGQDPYDPTETSTYLNSLFYQMEQRGLSLSDTGGISHQTVGGFLSTGSAGGSLTYSLEPNIYAFEVVDGTGAVHTCSREENPDLFHAVGVSMGLLGIITKVTFKADKRFDIVGSEHIRPIEDYKGWIDFFGDGADSLTAHLKSTEYTRLLWWPQKGTKKMTVWEARKMKDEDYKAPNSIVHDNKKVFVAKPYHEVQWDFGSPLLYEYLGDAFYTTVAWWPTYLTKFISWNWWRMFVQSFIETTWYGWLLPKILNVFVPTDKKEGSNWTAQHFWDTWWRGLPMDNQMDDRVMGVVFTEIWVPLEHTSKVMRALRDHYDRKGLAATGTFSCELYATKSSEFWMSPSYKTDVFRVDLFLSATDTFNPKDYYQQFWDLLKPYQFRTHWGKWQPGDEDSASENERWREYLRGNYPKWDAFLALRDQLDPDQIFVNDYWRSRFGIPVPNGKTLPPPLEWTPPVPPHMIKQLGPDAPPPNNALLVGAPSLPKPPFYVYPVMIGVGAVAFAALMWIMTILIPWYTWHSDIAKVVITVIIACTVGVASVIMRGWGPIGVWVITYGMIMVGNLLNALTGDRMWEWFAILGLPLWVSAAIGEVFESALAASFVWLVGSKLFKKYWPQ